MTGLLGLVGGREHGTGCEDIDRHVLAAVAHDDPVVAIVPLASSLRTRARTVGRAIGWWEQLEATALVTGPDLRAARRLLDRADVIVMTGGVPDRLHRRLVLGGLHEHVVARWRAGAHLVGSSSGAMVVAGTRQSVRPPFSVRRGLGLVPDMAVAPHHELGLPHAVATWRTRTHPHTLIVGIDEATALLGRGHRFEVRGVGTVVARRGTWQRTYRRGECVDLRRLGVMGLRTEPDRITLAPAEPLNTVSADRPPIAALRSVATGDAVTARTP